MSKTEIYTFYIKRMGIICAGVVGYAVYNSLWQVFALGICSVVLVLAYMFLYERTKL